MRQLIPAILTADEADYARKLKLLEQIGVKEVQIDVIDGKFVDNKTVGLDVINKYSTAMRREVHLMVVNPVAAAKEYLAAGIDSLIIHYEMLFSLFDLDQFARRPVGLAIDPETPVSSIIGIAGGVSLILIMGVKAGFSGQTFLPETLNRVRQLRQAVPTGKIEVDGGVSDELIAKVFAAGADKVVFNCQRIVESSDPGHYWSQMIKKYQISSVTNQLLKTRRRR
ncbi:ribulose-phosphate 3-epimerase [Candidatus Berkelbacteria bacterium]|nr:ribulose-phosphate 3-epimerase [Candidatus Berkelbacteria bacterium]